MTGLNRIRIEMSRTQKTKIIFLSFIALMLFMMFSSISYFSDDWLWGSYKSLRIFLGSFSDPSNPWHDYPNNGRYLGNFLGFIGANCFFLRNLIMTAVLCLIILELGKICSIITEKSPDPLVVLFLPAALLLLTPSGLFSQTVAWTSSFMNYAVPSAFFLILLRKLFTQKDDASFDIIFVLIPLFSAFFVENLTIGSILFIVLWVAYRFLRKEKPTVNEWIFLLSALAGLILMFLDDGYRQVFETAPNKSIWHARTGSIAVMLQAGIKSFQKPFVFHLFRGFSLINLWGALNIFLVCLSEEVRIDRNGKTLRFLGLSELLIGCYFVIRLINPSWQMFLGYTGIVEAVLALLFILIIPIIGVMLQGSRRQKEYTVFVWIFVICITAPLLVADPLTVRVFFPTYIFFLLIYCRFAWVNLCRFVQIAKIDPSKWIRLGLIGLFLLAWGFRTSIYAVESHYEKERVKYIRNQEAAGDSPILLPKMPYADYIIVSWPDGDKWQERYKRFYGLNLDLKYELISLEEWKERTGDK